MKDFLPEYGALPIGGMYVPVFRLFAGENWKQVRRDRKRLLCGSATEAIRAAKDHVKAILNPAIRGEKIIARDADPLGVVAWRMSKAGESAEQQEAVLGAIIVRGKEVKIERRRRA